MHRFTVGDDVEFLEESTNKFVQGKILRAPREHIFMLGSIVSSFESLFKLYDLDTFVLLLASPYTSNWQNHASDFRNRSNREGF